MWKRMAGTLAATMLVGAQATAGCWTADEAAAASVRDLQTMLMVASLRCHLSGHEMMEAYNAFLEADRLALQDANGRIKRHFLVADGAVAGQRAYDGFTTRLANGYGDHAASAEGCGEMRVAARDAEMMAGSLDGLVELAGRIGVSTALPGGLCERPAGPVEVAAAAPVHSAAPVADAAVPSLEVAQLDPAVVAAHPLSRVDAP